MVLSLIVLQHLVELQAMSAISYAVPHISQCNRLAQDFEIKILRKLVGYQCKICLSVLAAAARSEPSGLDGCAAGPCARHTKSF